MQIKKQSPRRLFTFIIIVLMAGFIVLATRQERAAPLSRQQTESERQQSEAEKVRRNKAALPRADYDAPEPQTLELRQIRKARDKRHGAIMPFENVDEEVIELPRVSHDLLNIPGLPVEQSDLIVMGTIT